MKICTDCKWCQYKSIPSVLGTCINEYVCERPRLPYPDPVTGKEVLPQTLICHTERGVRGPCGYEGTYWEAK